MKIFKKFLKWLIIIIVFLVVIFYIIDIDYFLKVVCIIYFIGYIIVYFEDY